MKQTLFFIGLFITGHLIFAQVQKSAPAGFDALRSDIPHGKLDTLIYESSTVGTKRKVLVYTPPGFSKKKKYPVLYLLHGIGGNAKEWLNGAQPQQILDNLYTDGKAAPMIVVMPNGRAMKDDRAVGNIFDSLKVQAFATFEQDLLDDLIPFIQKKYKVYEDANHRAVAGLSMGGGQSLNFGLGNLDTFAWVGGFSSAPNTKAPDELIPDPAMAKEKLKLLWISCGDKDGLIHFSQRTHDYLEKNGVPHVYYIEPGGHDFKAWKNDLYRFAQLVFKPVEPAVYGQYEAISESLTTTITNPILSGFYPDPSILRVGTDYYLVNSTFAYFPGLPVLHSKDLKNWKQIGNVISRPSQMDFMGHRMTRGLFAPTIDYNNGTYYVTCTLIDKGGNFVMTANDPAGPWSDPYYLPEVSGIDPSLFFDDDKAYIMYNSNPPDNISLYRGHRTVRMYEFDPIRMKVLGEEKILINGGVDISKEPVWIEAPHILKRNSWYYLYAAEGGTSVNHSEVVLRSKDVWGPYIPYENNPILTQRDLPADRKNAITSAGHAQFVEGPDGKTYAVFLAVRPYEGDYYNTGRETFIAPVIWKNEWPIVDLGAEEIQYSYTVNYPEVKQWGALPQSGNFEYKFTFDKELDPSFLFLRTCDSSSFEVSKEKGLTIQVKPETVMELSNPSFIGKRQQHLFSSLETSMDFTAASENEKAGLIIFQDEKHFYYLSKSTNNDKAVLQLFKSNPETDKMEVLKQVNLSTTDSKLGLRINAVGDTYSFEYTEKADEWTLLKDKVDAKFLSTKVAGGFIGCLYGFYATSNGQESTNSASYEYYEYKGNDPMYKK